MAASDNLKIQKLIKSAEELARRGERQKALTEFNNILDIDPDNEKVRKRISELQREASVMRNFKRTRASRTHNAGKSVNSEDFIAECMKRSEEAFKAGDEVRALQELERAKRHDPDNRTVRKKILIVRRRIKTDNLYDMALAKLAEGDIESAVRKARSIFSIWPSAPVLSRLLDKLEAWKPAESPDELEAGNVELLEDLDFEENFQEVSEPAQGTKEVERTETSAAEAAIAAIRARISRSDFSGALDEAQKALEEHPGNSTIVELVERLKKLSGEKKAAEAVPAESEKKKLPLIPIIAVLALILIAVVFLVIKPFKRQETAAEEVIVPEVTFEPYSVNYTVSGPERFSVTVDGQAVNLLPDGSFTIEGDSEGTRFIEVRASGYETYKGELVPSGGENAPSSISMDTLGTNTVVINFSPMLPEEADPSAEDGIIWFVDGEPAESGIVLPTGIHVFQAELEGFNSVPESILVDYSSEPEAISLALLSQAESQVILSLGADIPGTALFYIDGSMVGSDVRRVSEILPFGRHTITVEAENYELWSRTITLDSDGYSTTVVPVQIVTTGRLLIAPEPWANVSVDGVSVGQTPMAPLELEEGSHTVVLTNPDYQDQTITVSITPGEDTSIAYDAEPAEPEGPDIIEEEEPTIPPFAISQVAPETPGLARDMGDVHGYITLDVLVGTDGSVKDVTIVSDELGLGCGAAAEAAVRQWVFNPATQGGVPVEVTTRVQVRFDVE
ncbi:hypothetical protein CSA37_04670 [Candidatus Fermentibacteria bacterium]|nr:MAG: hypothetical protein CSA37_04670 [Candidatus Fermentibacteria bacterium]